MATIEFKGIAEYQKQLDALGKDSDKALKYAIYDAAGMIIEEIKAATPVDTGDLRDSLTLTPMVNKDGFVNTKVEFAGYDRKGVPNTVKARVLESGSSRRRKQPFVRKAVNRKKKAAQQMMQISLDKYFNEKFRK